MENPFKKSFNKIVAGAAMIGAIASTSPKEANAQAKYKLNTKKANTEAVEENKYKKIESKEFVKDSVLVGFIKKSEEKEGLFERYIENEKGEILFLNYEDKDRRVISFDKNKQERRKSVSLGKEKAKEEAEDFDFREATEWSLAGYDKKYADKMWEERNSIDTTLIKNITESKQKQIDFEIFYLERTKNDTNKFYNDLLLNSVYIKLLGLSKEDVISDRDSKEHKLLNNELERIENKLKELQATIDTLNSNPEIIRDHRTYEEMLNDGKLFQEEGEERLKRFSERQHNLKNIDSLFIKLDKEKEWLNRVLHSKEYLEKFTKYENMSINDFIERVKRLNNGDYKIDFDYLSHSHYEEDDSTGVDNGVVFEVSDANEYSQGVHEYEHKITRGEFAMSEYAKKLYEEAVDHEGLKRPVSFESKIVLEDTPLLTNPSEVDARKKVFEYNLEKLGIWKYGETFTEEHYKKALELMEEGKLEDNSVQFLKMIKPEYIQKIMNTIAFLDEKENLDKA